MTDSLRSLTIRKHWIASVTATSVGHVSSALVLLFLVTGASRIGKPGVAIELTWEVAESHDEPADLQPLRIVDSKRPEREADAHDLPVEKTLAEVHNVVIEQPEFREDGPEPSARITPAALAANREKVEPPQFSCSGTRLPRQHPTPSISATNRSVTQPSATSRSATARPATQSASRGLSRPRKLAGAEPAYPPAAITAGLRGKVVIRLHISHTGKVETASLVRSSGHGILDRAALLAVQRWRYAPAKNGGRPVRCQILVPLRFDY